MPAALIPAALHSPSSASREAPDAEILSRTFFASKKASTLRAYRKSLEAWAAFQDLTVEDATAGLLRQTASQAHTTAERWKAAMTAEGKSPSTVNSRLSALRSLVEFLARLGHVAWTLRIANRKARRLRDTAGPGRDAVVRLIKACRACGGPRGARDEALIRLLHDTALRRFEVTGLDFAHVDLAAARLSILGKGRDEREWVHLPEETAKSLSRWLEYRGPRDGPLFTALSSGSSTARLSDSGLRLIVKDLGEAVGARVRPHGLRHTGITGVLDATNGDIRAAQTFARHADARTTTLYDDNRQDAAGKAADAVSIKLDN